MRSIWSFSRSTHSSRVEIVIEYCENGPGDDSDPDGSPVEVAEPVADGAAAERASWGRQPDRNGEGLTRREVARRMLAEGLPLAPRAIAEAFHETGQASRGQVESVRRVLRRLVKSGFARVLPDGTYVVGGGFDDAQSHEPAPAAHDAQEPQPEPPAAAGAAGRGGTWIPRLITGLADQPTLPAPSARPVGGHPFAVSAGVLLQLLATAGRAMRARELAQALGRQESGSQLESIRQTLRRCVERGQAVLLEPGLWAIAPLPAAEGRAGIAGAGI